MERPFELCSIDIAVGTLSLRHLDIGMTYGGVIEGRPDERFNDRVIERLGRMTGNGDQRIHVVPPERIIENGREYLPHVQCVGRFHGPCTSNNTEDWVYTHLTVGWFQQPCASGLISPEAITRMYNLPWLELATDVRWHDM
ncbi:hypothetical protein [Nocardia sp. NPDC005978]|uniref:hypothetical protein n=1 Tax=unclassified Nocardia TaxID=2637762 RepID=UPI0033AB622F